MAKKKTTKKSARKTVRRTSIKADHSCADSECRCGTWWRWIISEGAFYAFLYLTMYYLNISDGTWYKALFLWLLANISIILCPVLNKCLCD